MSITIDRKPGAAAWTNPFTRIQVDILKKVLRNTRQMMRPRAMRIDWGDVAKDPNRVYATRRSAAEFRRRFMAFRPKYHSERQVLHAN